MFLASAYSFSSTEWVLIFFSAFIIGLTKGGIKGVDMLSVTLMAIVFGSKTSTGIVLPMLCFADIAAVAYYKRHVQWKYFWKITPWMIIGILLGVYFGKEMNEVMFKKVMAIIILITIGIVLFMEYRKSKLIPENRLFAVSTGLAAGFTTMIGNLAGAFSNLYFLAMRVSKNDFIGTGAWIFLFMNLFKLPFQVFYWKNITRSTMQLDLLLLPALAIGFILGVTLVKKIQDEQYRKIVIVLTLIGSLIMLLKN